LLDDRQVCGVEQLFNNQRFGNIELAESAKSGPSKAIIGVNAALGVSGGYSVCFTYTQSKCWWCFKKAGRKRIDQAAPMIFVFWKNRFCSPYVRVNLFIIANWKGACSLLSSRFSL